MQLRLPQSRVRQSFSQPRSFRSQTERSFDGNSKELALPSTSPLERCFSPAVLCLPKPLPPAPFNTTKVVFEVPVSTTTIPPLVFKTSDFDKNEHKMIVLNADYLAQAARLSDPDHVQKLCSTVREVRWMNAFGSFSAAEKNPLSDRLSALPPVLGGKLVVLFNFVDGLHRLALIEAFDDFGIDWASLV